MSDPYERYKAMRNAALGNITKHDIEVLCGRPLAEAPSRDSYEMRQISKETFKGMRVEVFYGKDKAVYLVDAWINGKGIYLHDTYRVFEEDDRTAEVGVVFSGQEKQKVREGIEAQIRQVLSKKSK